MVNIQEQSEYSELYEGIIEAIKSALSSLAEGEEKLVDEIIDGDENLGERDSVLMVVGGPDRIISSGTRNLQHTIEIYLCYLSRAVKDPETLKRLRNIAGHGYDLLMADITLGGEVLFCVPRLVHPGFMRYGDYVYVGVLQTWHAIKRQGFTTA